MIEMNTFEAGIKIPAFFFLIGALLISFGKIEATELIKNHPIEGVIGVSELLEKVPPLLEKKNSRAYGHYTGIVPNPRLRIIGKVGNPIPDKKLFTLFPVEKFPPDSNLAKRVELKHSPQNGVRVYCPISEGEKIFKNSNPDQIYIFEGILEVIAIRNLVQFRVEKILTSEERFIPPGTLNEIYE